METVFCFIIKDNDALEKIRNYEKISTNPEDFVRCAYRERWQEIEYFSNRNRAVFYNKETNEFTWPDFTPLDKDMSNSIVWPRVNVPEFRPLAMQMLEKGWNIISKPYQLFAIEYWPIVIPPSISNRKMIYSTKENASMNFDNYYNSIKDERGRFFIKSLHKNWSYSGSKEGWLDGMAFSLSSGSANDPVLFSEFIDFAEDEHDTLEYRCFVVNKVLLSISRYMDYELIEIPQDVYEYAEKVIEKIAGKYLPETFVLDIGRKQTGELFIIEFNDVSCSGRYIGNTVESLDG